MAADAHSDCSRTDSDSCPAGHELAKCRNRDGYQCKQCSALSFQPNENRLGDRCRLRRVCGQPHMVYKEHGSTTRDADCDCDRGFHFENVDQRACVPNRYCPKGYGQGEYGVCVQCIDQNMYSDTYDREHKCKPLTNCEKQSRCTISKSNGTFDNVCGPKVKDVKSCDDPQPLASEDVDIPRQYIIAGGIVGSLILILVFLLIFYIARRNNLRRQKYAQKPLSPDQLEELKVKILKECERDSVLCKKVLSKSVFVVEERIERQIWTLAQELYRPHPVTGKYELIVEKYKESLPKYAVNGYMQEWKLWRTESKDAVTELFRCLRHCKRDDIVYEICNGLRHDVGFEVDMEAQMEEDGTYNRAKHSCMEDVMEVFCPCCHIWKSDVKATPQAKVVFPKKGEKDKDPEASGKLLEVSSLQHAQPVDVDSHLAKFRSRPCPSAPTLDHEVIVYPDYYRQCSQPVQATT